MTKTATKKVWTKPTLARIGTIEDVSGPNPLPVQNANNS